MARPLPQVPIRFHQFALSGHCHRVGLLLSMLELPHETIDVDLPGGAHKSEAFLAMNPFGQVPVVEDGKLVLGDSLAIMVYLAQTYGEGRWTPRNPLEAAEQQRWFALAAGALAFGPAAARIHKLFGAPLDLPAAQARAQSLFAVMESELGTRRFLAGAQVTLADLAHYAYVARAPEGGIGLEPYPNIRSWLARIESLPGFVPMPTSVSN